MSHLGQRLSALIDGELAGDERDRVLSHLARCGGCRDEAAALRTLKRRMNALGEAAAGAGLTGRLMGLSEVIGPWPQGASPWQFPAEGTRSSAKTTRYFLGGSVAVFLAAVSTAAFIAGGDPQVQSPAPKVTPQVGVYLLEQNDMNGLFPNDPVQPRSGQSAAGGNFRQLP